MPKRYLTFAALLVSCNAVADDLPTRIAAGTAAMSTVDGRAYDGSLAPAIGSAIRRCAPAGGVQKDNVGRFVLVGNIDHTGRLSGVVVEPATRVSRCFATQLTATPLPAPPRKLRRVGGYPLTVEMEVTQ